MKRGGTQRHATTRAGDSAAGRAPHAHLRTTMRGVPLRADKRTRLERGDSAAARASHRRVTDRLTSAFHGTPAGKLPSAFA
jgi:hypothetical protein